MAGVRDDYRTLIELDWLFVDVKKPTLEELEEECHRDYGKKSKTK